MFEYSTCTQKLTYRFPSCSTEKSSRMIPVPSWVASEVGKEAIGPEVPIQIEMRILGSVDQWSRIRQDDCVPPKTFGIRGQVFFPNVRCHIS